MFTATTRNNGRTASNGPRSRSALFGAALALCAGAGFSAAAVNPPPFDSKTADFAIAFHDEVTAFRDASAFVLPEEPVTFEATGGPDGEFSLTAITGAVAQFGKRKWRWTAPKKPGVYDLTFEAPEKGVDRPARRDAIVLKVFVMVPADHAQDGMLNGYRIGRYPDTPLNNNPIYRPPLGFIEVTKQNQDTKVSPHFRVKQFLCKQDAPNDFPKYLVLHERLPLKLEAALQQVNAAGFAVDTLHVMSGFRTPYYNHAIGDVKYSMHQWGRAADFYVDQRDKGVMDDLTRDGRVDTADAKYLYDLIEQLLARPGFQRLQGGMGYYPATSAHPPFVHVDVRGSKARWKG